MKLSARLNPSGKRREIDFPFPETANDLLQEFGIDRVHGWAMRAIRIEVQLAISQSTGLTDKELLSSIRCRVGP